MRPAPALWLLYAAFILYGGTIPFHFSGDAAAAFDRLWALPLNPLVSPETGRRLSFPDVVQNVLFFLPFGALGFLAGTRQRPRVGQTLRRIAFVTLLGVALSAGVEGLQLLTNDRVSSLGDLMCNTAGALVGGLLAWQLRANFAAGLRRLRAEGLANVDELRPAAIGLLLMLIFFWQPFDVTLEVGTVLGKVRGLERDLWQYTGLRDEGTSLMICAFFTMTLASYLSVLGERNAARKTAALAIGLVFFLEASEVVIGSRTPGLWDALVAVSGVLIGVVLWSGAARIVWPSLWLGVLVALTFVAAALQMLSPFEISAHYRAVEWLPFLAYYTRTTFETLSHVIELMLLYFPLGYWLGQTQPSRRRAVAAGLGLTLAIAAPVEYFQGWVVGRYPDVSDVCVSLFGVLVGVRVAATRT